MIKAKGIKMAVHGCGCCGSPSVKFGIDGTLIANEANFNFDMFDEEGVGFCTAKK